MNILIAEDSLVIQMVMKARMDCWGFSCDLASNGREAVELAQSNDGKYDICLMDLGMPIMDGITAAKIIRATTRYFPIIAYSSEQTREPECYEAGFDDFVLKEVNSSSSNALLRKIKERSLKIYEFTIKSNFFDIKEIKPVDRQQAEELRLLAKKGLCKVSFYENPGKAIIIHKNVINKVTHDFNVKGRLLTTFLNRDSETPTLCHLFKESNNLVPQKLLPEEYEKLLSEEDGSLSEYTSWSLNGKTE